MTHPSSHDTTIPRILALAAMTMLLAFAAMGMHANAAWAEGEQDEQAQATESTSAQEQAGETGSASTSQDQASTSEGSQATADSNAANASSSTAADTTGASSSTATSANDTSASGAAGVTVNADGISIGRDVFIANREVTSKDMEAAANLFVAGQNLNLSGAKVGADVFAAGQTLNLSEFTAGNNLFVSGGNVTVSSTTATNLFAAGNNLDISADVKNASLAGSTVFLKGTYDGNVDVTGSNVVIDPYIVVTGTLNVTAEQEPTIASTAKVGSFNYNQVKRSDSASPAMSFAVIGTQAWLWGLLLMFLGMLLLCVAMLLVLRTEVVDSTGALLKERPLAIFLTGLISIIVLPLLTVGLFATGVGWTVALALFFGCILATAFAGTYTAISIGRAVLSRVNKWISSIIFVIVFALLFCIPIVNIVLAVLSTLFCSGSIIQGWWVWRRADRNDRPFPTGGQPDYSEFAVPRGTHVNPPVTENAIPPIPASNNIPTRNSAEYRPSDLG